MPQLETNCAYYLLEIPEGVLCKNYYNRDVNKPIYYNQKIFKYQAVVSSTNHPRRRITHVSAYSEKRTHFEIKLRRHSTHLYFYL